MPRHRIYGALLVGVLAVLIIGLIRLFQLHFAIGDVYPAYSSLRSDPIGSKAFHDALAEVHGTSSSRNYRNDWDRGEAGATVFFLGERIEGEAPGDREFLSHVEDYARRGGRVVLAYYPLGRVRRVDQESEQSDRQKEKKTEPPGKDRPTRRPWETLGIRMDLTSLRSRHAVTAPAVVAAGSPAGLPASISWHSILSFELLQDDWKTIYARAGKPVLIARALGRGSMVLVADSYLFSNEALRREPHAALLAWLVGPHSDVVFDETHLGVAESAGVMSLARKYRLHGLLAGMLLLAVLFVWHNAAPFLPPTFSARRARRARAGDESSYVAGRDSASAFVNLLRRNISRGDLLRTCFQEWNKTAPPTVKPDDLERMRKLVDQDNGQQIIRDYRSLCDLAAPLTHHRNEQLRANGSRK